MHSVFDTSPIRPQRRFHAWREIMNDTFFPMHCVAKQDESAFNGEIEQVMVGPGTLYGIRSKSIHYGRDHEEIRHRQSDTCQLFLLREGTVRLTQQERQVVLKAGDMCLYDTNLPFFLDMPDRYDSLVLQLPRTMMEVRLPGLHNLLARPINDSAGVARLLRHMLVDTSTLGSQGETLISARLGLPIMEVVALALESGFPQTEDHSIHRHTALLARLKSSIQDQLDNPKIDLQGIAAGIGISRRTMNRLFAREGSTPTHWLWQQRLAASYQALSQGQNHSVTEVALAYGFTSLSHFSRSFRQAFGVSPKTLVRPSKH